MNPLTHILRRRSVGMLAIFFATSLATLCVGQSTALKEPVVKAPITHKDYDIWNSIQGPQISPNGQFVAYNLASQEGQSEMIVRDVQNDVEFHYGGGKSGAAAKGGGKGAGAGKGGASKAVFTADSRRLVFMITPKGGAGKKADPEKKTDPDKKAEQGKDAPQASLGIMNLADGSVKVISGVRAFALPEDDPGGVIYHKVAPKGAAEKKDDAEKKIDALQADDEDDDFDGIDFQQKGKKGGGGDKKQGPPVQAKGVGSDLVIHVFESGSESVIPDVTEFNLTRDGRLIVCNVAGKDSDAGVYAVLTAGPPGKLAKLPLATAKAKYSRFTWDEKQRHLLFLADTTPNPKEPSTFSVMLWDREAALNDKLDKNGPAAIEVFNSKLNTGLKPGYALTDKGSLTLTEDGSKIIVGVALPLPPQDKEAKKAGGKDDKALVELWHWKDEYIQPMLKVKGGADKGRTYSAIYHIKSKKLVQLADKAMPNVNLTRDGGAGIGTDDVPYRPLVAYDGNYSDIYLVNTFDGTRKPLLKKHRAGVTLSPSGKHGIFFDGKDWNSVALPGGKVTNLTKKIETKFWNVDHDSPSAPGSYGVAGWSSDDYYVLLYDKYDIWEVSTKGTGHRNLTQSAKRAPDVQFRHLKLDTKAKTIDMNEPLFLRAENLRTRDEGFYTVDPRNSRGPAPLIMQPCAFGVPTKAKYGNTLLFTVQRFSSFPDLYVASTEFKNLARITDANPHIKNFNWGQSEMVYYKNADGVPLSGVLIRPENFDSSKKYPMMVYIYEKLSQNLHNFVLPKEGTSINTTYYASNGYVVLLPDIVYTVGYPGQSALKCVLPAIQAVVEKGYVDENAIGIQGHSWGGYQIAYMVTQTNRFKAAAAGAPVANMTSAYDGIRWGTGLPRQFQYEKTQSRIGGSLWEYPMRFIENSPIFMADRVKTPLMILHNDQDDAVPWYQGIEYYLALRRLGKEVYMFNYIGEKHGIGKKANKMDYTIRMQQFFDHELRAAPRPEWMEKGLPFVPKGAANPKGGAGGEPEIGGGGGGGF